jgi:hypothetical protein
MPEINLIKTGMKLSLILLCVLLFLLLSSSSALAAMMGDVNDDGRVNVQDVILVQKHILSPSLTTAQQAVADVNGDGVINVRDATLIMQYSLGLITEFPVGPSTPGVKSVRAIASDTITVEFFDTPTVAEKATLTITIRNVSNLVVPTTVSWNENVAMVSRLLGQSYSAGTFSVEVLGITPPYNGYVVFTAASALKVKIEATSLPVNTERAPLRVKLLDQYGDELPVLDITFDRTAYNLTTNTPVTINFDPRAHFHIDTRLRIPHLVTPGVVTTQRFAFNVGDEIRVTFVHRATGLEETVVIPITPEVQLGSITFGEIILPALRTVLTKDLRNVRIPFEAKDQNGNPLILVDGANVNLYSSDQSVVANSNLRFTWVDGKQYILIERFLSKGPVIITVIGTPGGVVGNKFLNVEEGLPFKLEVIPPEPATMLLPSRLGIIGGTSTTIRLRVVDQFGRPVSLTDDNYVIRTIKSSGTEAILRSPENNDSYSLLQAGGTGIQIVSADSPGRNDTITFRLQTRDGTFVDSIHRTIYVIEPFDRLAVTTDSTSYLAGDRVTVTIRAILNNRIHENYNRTGLAEIVLSDPSWGGEVVRVRENVTFRNGEASASFIARRAGNYTTLAVSFMDSAEYPAEELIRVIAGLQARFRLERVGATNVMRVFITDSQDNVITAVTESRDLILTIPDEAIPPVGSVEFTDADGRERYRLGVNFVDGVVTPDLNFGRIVKGTYTIRDENNNISGTRTLTD